MAGDLDVLAGKWLVKVRPAGRKEPWTWEYDFSPGGAVTWRDMNSPEHGSGRWTHTPKLVNITWNDSDTRESWSRPLSPTQGKAWYESSYFRGAYKIEKPVCPGFCVEGPVKLAAPPEIYQTGLLCWAAGSAAWLRATGRGTATVAELVKKYRERQKLDSADALPEQNIVEVFSDIGIAVKSMAAFNFTYCYVLEKLKTKGHLVLMAGSAGNPMGHTQVVWGVGDPSNLFYDVFDPLTGQGYVTKSFSNLSGTIYVGWAK